MPRLLGVDIPNNKRTEYALRYIYGIGPTRAKKIVTELEIDPAQRSQDLTEQQINKISELIVSNQWMIEGDLRRDIAGNMKRLQAIQCYRGLRHRRGLPARGQRTSTNARTRKGGRKTVGVVSKK
ncbi:MAG: 30S ribosomal protein S13 [Opitutaceae bacterium]|nr:30S ribosomal protein S13 [Opitutaceae bacterium]|tara:strand:+ start:403 stop:777 length:375 start_codon:yes stop_codon:yes gene_type:complete